MIFFRNLFLCGWVCIHVVLPKYYHLAWEEIWQAKLDKSIMRIVNYGQDLYILSEKCIL